MSEKSSIPPCTIYLYCALIAFGEYDEARVTIIDDLCATAKGYETLASSSLRRRDKG